MTVIQGMMLGEDGENQTCEAGREVVGLIKQLWHMGIHDRRILMIIKKMLRAGVMDELTATELGTPQGGFDSLGKPLDIMPLTCYVGINYPNICFTITSIRMSSAGTGGSPGAMRGEECA
jgi:hypothetical protein